MKDENEMGVLFHARGHKTGIVLLDKNCGFSQSVKSETGPDGQSTVCYDDRETGARDVSYD